MDGLWGVVRILNPGPRRIYSLSASLLVSVCVSAEPSRVSLWNDNDELFTENLILVTVLRREDEVLSFARIKLWYHAFRLLKLIPIPCGRRIPDGTRSGPTSLIQKLVSRETNPAACPAQQTHSVSGSS
ncbi:hypothetical protein D9613_012633 [Agrocybe pediades]|uniref:Uncharacterized protein n=1 Tax=Agrocybe pediades TaxID=84607 RepID=A0A8H4QV63_9AGAR|nr:hypothetical protein D9613_012633 [Agrocybe pediades]